MTRGQARPFLQIGRSGLSGPAGVIKGLTKVPAFPWSQAAKGWLDIGANGLKGAFASFIIARLATGREAQNRQKRQQKLSYWAGEGHDAQGQINNDNLLSDFPFHLATRLSTSLFREKNILF